MLNLYDHIKKKGWCVKSKGGLSQINYKGQLSKKGDSLKRGWRTPYNICIIRKGVQVSLLNQLILPLISGLMTKSSSQLSMMTSFYVWVKE